MNSVLILNTDINVTNIDEVAEILQQKNSKTVAVCNTNTLVRSYPVSYTHLTLPTICSV